MSLSQTQEIMMVCREIIDLLNNAELKTTQLVKELPATKELLLSVRSFERVAVRSLALTRQMGLPDNVLQQINLFSQLVVLMRMVHINYKLIGAGPIGIILGMLGFALTGASVYNSIRGTQ